MAAVAVSLAVLGGRAAAQEQTPAVEVGVAAGGVFTQLVDFEGAGLSTGAGEVRVTVPITSRFAVEGGLMVAPGQTCCYRTFEGFYTGQVRQRLTTDRGPGFFVTYGLSGYLAHESHGPLQFPQPDGSVVSGPPYHNTIVEAPFLTTVGVGFDHALTRRVAVRTDVQSMSVLWIPLGVRASAGVSIGFGRR